MFLVRKTAKNVVIFSGPATKVYPSPLLVTGPLKKITFFAASLREGEIQNWNEEKTCSRKGHRKRAAVGKMSLTSFPYSDWPTYYLGSADFRARD